MQCYFYWCDNETERQIAYCEDCLQEHFDENGLPKVVNSLMNEIWLACEAVVLENLGHRGTLKFRHNYVIFDEIPKVNVVGILKRRRIAGDYSPKKRLIRLMPNPSLLEYVGTLIHELSHHFIGNTHNRDFFEFGKMVLDKLGFKYDYYRNPYTNRVLRRWGWKLIGL